MGHQSSAVLEHTFESQFCADLLRQLLRFLVDLHFVLPLALSYDICLYYWVESVELLQHWLAVFEFCEFLLPELGDLTIGLFSLLRNLSLDCFLDAFVLSFCKIVLQ